MTSLGLAAVRAGHHEPARFRTGKISALLFSGDLTQIGTVSLFASLAQV